MVPPLRAAQPCHPSSRGCAVFPIVVSF
jgi:hypothetical protein